MSELFRVRLVDFQRRGRPVGDESRFDAAGLCLGRISRRSRLLSGKTRRSRAEVYCGGSERLLWRRRRTALRLRRRRVLALQRRPQRQGRQRQNAGRLWQRREVGPMGRHCSADAGKKGRRETKGMPQRIGDKLKRQSRTGAKSSPGETNVRFVSAGFRCRPFFLALIALAILSFARFDRQRTVFALALLALAVLTLGVLAFILTVLALAVFALSLSPRGGGGGGFCSSNTRLYSMRSFRGARSV